MAYWFIRLVCGRNPACGQPQPRVLSRAGPVVLWPVWLFDDQITLRFLVKIVEKTVTAGLERADPHCDRATTGDHFLHAQRLDIDHRHHKR